MKAEPLEKFIAEKGKEILEALDRSKNAPATEKLAQVGVIALRWFVEGAIQELNQSKPRP